MRIREYPKVTSYDPTDVILIDKETGGTKQLQLGDIGSLSDGIVLKTLTVEGWQLTGSVYTQTIRFNKIYSMKPIITACGSTLGTLATDEQYAALGGLKVVGDTEAKTFTFTASSAPSVAINLSIQGVA